MNNKFNETIKHLKEIKMTEIEKSNILASLKATMSYNPIRTLPVKSPYGGNIRSTSSGQVFGMQYGKFASMMAAVLIVVMGAGVSGAAANALPGDLLYPIKINLNENMKLALSSPKTKIRVQEKLLARRLDEVVALSKRGNLDEKSVSTVEIGLTKHTDILNKEIVKLRDEKNETLAVELSENVNTSFKEHESSIVSASLIKNTDEEFESRLQSAFVKNSSKAFALRAEFYDKEAKEDDKLAETKDEIVEKTATKPELNNDTKTTITVATPQKENFRLVITFSSKGSGINTEAVDGLDAMISRFKKSMNLNIESKKSSWGREGELDYCLNFPNTEDDRQTEIVNSLIASVSRFELVTTKENTNCREPLTSVTP